MLRYPVNKGVGKSVEFKGIRAQYVLYLAIGVLLSFLLFFVCSFIFVQWLAVLVCMVAILLTVGGVVFLNARFGEHGMTQFHAQRVLPGRIANNRRIHRLISDKGHEEP
ncbi:MAG: DUF4133 domain-containing protein [Paludibacteraceae bacterium]|nr:DUF4133 domain-containing protein [Paludibacteraceae bacterium]